MHYRWLSGYYRLPLIIFLTFISTSISGDPFNLWHDNDTEYKGFPSRITDNTNDLVILTDEIYELSGSHTYNEKIQINGTLRVRPYDGINENTGTIELKAKSIFLGPTGKILASGHGYGGGGGGSSSYTNNLEGGQGGIGGKGGNGAYGVAGGGGGSNGGLGGGSYLDCPGQSGTEYGGGQGGNDSWGVTGGQGGSGFGGGGGGGGAPYGGGGGGGGSNGNNAIYNHGGNGVGPYAGKGGEATDSYVGPDQQGGNGGYFVGGGNGDSTNDLTIVKGSGGGGGGTSGV